jgi:hypothetical protein
VSRQIHLLWCNEEEEWYLSWQLSNLSRLLSFPANVPPSFTSYPYLCSPSELFPASCHWPCYDLFPLFQHPTNCLSGPASAVQCILQIIHQELSLHFLSPASYPPRRISAVPTSCKVSVTIYLLSYQHPANYPSGPVSSVPASCNDPSGPVSLYTVSCKLSVRNCLCHS